MYRTRNILLVVAGIAVLALAVRFIDRRMDDAQTPTLPPGPDRVVEAPPARPPRIYRMEAPLEELRKIPALDGMNRADELATKMLPSGVETAGRIVQPDEVLEGYAHPNGRRFFVIMKPGTRAYSVFVEP
ncbi:MAG TPA: hypothetical protein VMF52_18445 [Steroidobacteraceae bacterium]|nr:hypothetical protein [Steroidobacteraceae bacterium]